MFWSKFYELCQSAGETPTSVVRKLEISTASITKWKAGTIPTAEILKKIASFFNVPMEYFLKDDAAEESKKNKVNAQFANLLLALSNGEEHQFTVNEKQKILDFVRFVKSEQNKSDWK